MGNIFQKVLATFLLLFILLFSVFFGYGSFLGSAFGNAMCGFIPCVSMLFIFPVIMILSIFSYVCFLLKKKAKLSLSILFVMFLLLTLYILASFLFT